MNIYIYIYIYLVGGLEHLLFFHISGLITPTDFHIFQRGWNMLKPPTRYIYIYISNLTICRNFFKCPWKTLGHGGPRWAWRRHLPLHKAWAKPVLWPYWAVLARRRWVWHGVSSCLSKALKNVHSCIWHYIYIYIYIYTHIYSQCIYIYIYTRIIDYRHACNPRLKTNSGTKEATNIAPSRDVRSFTPWIVTG